MRTNLGENENISNCCCETTLCFFVSGLRPKLVCRVMFCLFVFVLQFDRLSLFNQPKVTKHDLLHTFKA